MSEGGINKLVYAINPEYMPGVDPFDLLTADIMHIFFCGFTRKELAWLFKILIPKYTSWNLLNEAVAALSLPRGKRISKLYPPLDTLSISQPPHLLKCS